MNKLSTNKGFKAALSLVAIACWLVFCTALVQLIYVGVTVGMSTAFSPASKGTQYMLERRIEEWVGAQTQGVFSAKDKAALKWGDLPGDLPYVLHSSEGLAAIAAQMGAMPVDTNYRPSLPEVSEPPKEKKTEPTTKVAEKQKTTEPTALDASEGLIPPEAGRFTEQTKPTPETNPPRPPELTIEDQPDNKPAPAHETTTPALDNGAAIHWSSPAYEGKSYTLATLPKELNHVILFFRSRALAPVNRDRAEEIVRDLPAGDYAWLALAYTPEQLINVRGGYFDQVLHGNYPTQLLALFGHRDGFVVVAAVSFLIGLLLLLWLLGVAGRSEYLPAQKRYIYELGSIDKISFEALLLVCFVLLALPVAVGAGLEWSFSSRWEAFTPGGWMAAGYLGLLGTLGFLLLQSAARRLRCHAFWSTCLLGKALRFVCVPIRDKLVRPAWRTLTNRTELPLVWLLAVCVGAGLALVFIEAELYGLLALEGLVIFFLFLFLFRDLNLLRRLLERLTRGEVRSDEMRDSLSYPQSRIAREQLYDFSATIDKAVDERLRADRLRNELITNVSHDLRTPLTSLISAVDLLKNGKLTENEKAQQLELLETKSARLRTLIEDLLEATKAASGSVPLHLESHEALQFLLMLGGELEDRLAAKDLTLVIRETDHTGHLRSYCFGKKDGAEPATESGTHQPLFVYGDADKLQRIFDNLFQNAAKYALPGSRIYVDLSAEGSYLRFVCKNISATALTITPDELLERFVRGDASRSEEGSGLGLSIARDLTQLQGGSFTLDIRDDLFTVSLTLPSAPPSPNQPNPNQPATAATPPWI